MYHDVYTQLDSEVPQSASLYQVSNRCFKEQLRIIRNAGISVVRAQEALRPRPGQAIVLTFDDGWAGTFRNALPLLAEFAFGAVVFVTRDFVGRKGFCDDSMLRAAGQAGVEIGVHGTTHRMLSSCSEEEILAEFRDCRDFLEQTLSKPVHLASLPGGDINGKIIAGARKAGLECLCTSRPGINDNQTPAFRLRRIAIRASTNAKSFERFCHLAVWPEVFRWSLLETPRLLLGMKNYSRLRRAVLDVRSQGPKRELFRP
jgi:peptidoglycan/xylan/chitin deacetylase (PgdA/CDA1 family)